MQNNNNKTISISPHLFQVNSGKGRTRKASREKKAPVVIPPVVSPNLLKKKLIQRLKNHKARENKDLAPQINSTSSKATTPTFVDEFNDSINYLQSLSNQTSAAARRSEAQRRTLKKHYEELEGITPQVNIDLPAELTDSSFPALTSGSITLKTDVPYGVLKNGSKPTFRQYQKTFKNVPSIFKQEGGATGNIREQKLENLRRKLDEMKKRKSASLQEPLSSEHMVSLVEPEPEKENLNDDNEPSNDYETVHIDLDELKEKEKQKEEEEKLLAQPVKQTLKTTKITKYTLGKNHDKRKVGVLLKNRSTRKKVLDACKKIKQEDIKNVKDFLKTHNFIKTGSNAPNHLYREMFQSLMLTGDSININKDTMLQNFAASS
jgi:hypothetical protein